MLSPRDPSVRASSLRIQHVRPHTVSSSQTPPTVSVPAGQSAFRYGEFTRARSCLSVRLATRQGARSRCVRSISATHHSLRTSTRTRLLPEHRQDDTQLPECPCVHLRGLRTLRTEESSVSRRSNRFSGSPGFAGSFRPIHACVCRLARTNTKFQSGYGDQHLTPLSLPSLAPRVELP